MKILLTADWQAKFSNLGYCELAHKQELALLANHKIDCHVDLGDLKDAYNPADLRVAEFMLQRAKNLSERVDNMIQLLGNHDRYGQHSDEKNWLEIFRKLNISKLHVVTRRTVVECAGTKFACLPYNKTAKGTLKASAALLERTADILLFHNDVAGTRYDNGLLSKTKITGDALGFPKYQACFGGHIHKHQQLAPNAWYVGNPFATDLGEIDQPKGFVVYDTTTRRIERIPSDVPGLYSWDYLKTNPDTNVPEGTRIRATVDCDNRPSYRTELDKTATKINTLFPRASVTVIPKFTKTVGGNLEANTNGLETSSSDLQKIEHYVEQHVPDALRNDSSKLVSFMSSTLQSVTGKLLSRDSGKVTFGRIVAKNVLSFKQIDYDLTKQGIVVVRGDNRDWPNHSNGAGKTSFLSIIPICIAGETFKGQKNDAWASDLNNDTAVAKLWLTNERSQRIKIVRCRRPAKLAMALNGRDVSSGLRSVGKTETQGQIEQFTGFNRDTLAHSVYIDQSWSNVFLHGTAKDRSDLIHQFQNLERFEDARKAVGRELTRVRANLEVFETTLGMQRAFLSEAETEIAESRNRIHTSAKQLKQAYLLAQTDWKTYVDASASRRSHLEKSHAQLHRKQTALNAKIMRCELTISEGTKKVDAHMSLMRKTLLRKETECPLCHRPHTKESKHEAEKQIAVQIHEVEERMREAEGRRDNYKLRYSKLVKRQTYLSAQIATVESHTTKLERDLREAKSAYLAVESVADASERDAQRNEHRKAKRLVKRAEDAVANTQREIAFLEFAQKAFGRDGLPAWLSSLLVPQLNKAAERYSDVFLDGEIQVVFEINKSQITPVVVNAHGGKTLQAQSMGENAWAALITSFALRDIAPPSNLLILDEPGNGMDPESARMFGQRLPRLKRYFDTILVVSHNPDINASLEAHKTLTVIKENKISRLEQ